MFLRTHKRNGFSSVATTLFMRCKMYSCSQVSVICSARNAHCGVITTSQEFTDVMNIGACVLEQNIIGVVTAARGSIICYAFKRILHGSIGINKWPNSETCIICEFISIIFVESDRFLRCGVMFSSTYIILFAYGECTNTNYFTSARIRQTLCFRNSVYSCPDAGTQCRNVWYA